jgi:hypothetical protein
MPDEIVAADRPTAIRTEIKLTEESFLSDDFVRQLMGVGEIDILVGLPTHNNAKTIISSVAAIQDGILRWFPRERAAIINVDGGSRDGTPDLVLSAAIDDVRGRKLRNALRTLPSISTKYGSSAERGTAFRTILAAADLLNAKAIVVVSPESNITPEWLPALLSPIYEENFDLVLPSYTRQKFDGLLLSNLLYPLTRALYGLRIHEPYATDYSFSGRIGSQFLSQNSWSNDIDRAAFEVRFSTAAITGGSRICQSFLGVKAHVERRASDLVPVLRQTIGELFSVMEPTFSSWSGKSGSEPVPVSGVVPQVTLEPVRINRKRLAKMFQTGVAELQSVFQSILSANTLAELQRIVETNGDEPYYPTELWVKTVYEFAAAHHKAVINRDHIVQALAPLFRGRVQTFLLENRNSSSAEMESNIENLCLEFERLKPYLLEIWK